jgi:hypothetical protein
MSKGQCILCGDVMESAHRHDFVRCDCGESFLDGGDDYFRGSMTTLPLQDGQEPMTAEEFLQVLNKWDKENDEKN